MKINKKALGYSLIILGLVVIFLKPLAGITGFSIANESLSLVQNVWFWIIGIGMIIVGVILSSTETRGLVSKVLGASSEGEDYPRYERDRNVNSLRRKLEKKYRLKTTSASKDPGKNEIYRFTKLLYNRLLQDPRKEKQAKINSLGEAAEKGMLGNYLGGKKLIFKTMPRGSKSAYDKHTQFLGRSISIKDFIDAIVHPRHGRVESQYLPSYSLDEIHEFEEKVVRKGRGYAMGAHRARVYGLSHEKPTGASTTGLTRGIAVELLEDSRGIHIHGYPVPESEAEKFQKKYKK